VFFLPWVGNFLLNKRSCQEIFWPQSYIHETVTGAQRLRALLASMNNSGMVFIRAPERGLQRGFRPAFSPLGLFWRGERLNSPTAVAWFGFEAAAQSHAPLRGTSFRIQRDARVHSGVALPPMALI